LHGNDRKRLANLICWREVLGNRRAFGRRRLAGDDLLSREEANNR
jgi:hypothetical protein